MTHPISEKKLDVDVLLSMLGDMEPMPGDPHQRYKTEWAREVLAQFAPRIAAEHIALTKKVDELEAALRSAFNVMGTTTDCLASGEPSRHRYAKDRLEREMDYLRTALNDTTQCRESDNG